MNFQTMNFLKYVSPIFLFLSPFVSGAEKEVAQVQFSRGKVSVLEEDLGLRTVVEPLFRRKRIYQVAQEKMLFQTLDPHQWNQDPDYLTFRKKTDREWATRKWFDQQSGVTAAQLQAYWKENQLAYGVHQLRLQQILLPDLETAQGVLKKLKEGADFQHLAEETSLDPDRKIKRGEVGWITRYQVDPLLFQQAIQTQDRQVAGPFFLPEGYAIIQVLERKLGRHWGFTEAEGEVRADLKESLIRKALEKLLGQGKLKLFL